MIRKVGGNVDAWNWIGHPERYVDVQRVSDLAVTQVPGKPITDEDKRKYEAAIADMKRRGIRWGRYINSQGARVGQAPKAVWPNNMIDVAGIPDECFYGPPASYSANHPDDVRRRFRLGCVEERIQEFARNAAQQVQCDKANQARATIADHIAREANLYPEGDLYLDGVIVPEVVESAVPWRFKQVCDLLSKIRQRIHAEMELGINLSGATAELTNSHIEMLVSAGVRLVTFEQSGAVAYPWKCAQVCGRMLLQGVLPVFDVKDPHEQTACEAICAAVGAAMAV